MGFSRVRGPLGLRVNRKRARRAGTRELKRCESYRYVSLGNVLDKRRRTTELRSLLHLGSCWQRQLLYGSAFNPVSLLHTAAREGYSPTATGCEPSGPNELNRWSSLHVTAERNGPSWTREFNWVTLTSSWKDRMVEFQPMKGGRWKRVCPRRENPA